MVFAPVMVPRMLEATTLAFKVRADIVDAEMVFAPSMVPRMLEATTFPTFTLEAVTTDAEMVLEPSMFPYRFTPLNVLADSLPYTFTSMSVVVRGTKLIPEASLCVYPIMNSFSSPRNPMATLAVGRRMMIPRSLVSSGLWLPTRIRGSSTVRLFAEICVTFP